MNFTDHPVRQSEDSPCPPAYQAFFPSDNASKSSQSDSISILCSLVSEQMKQHQQMMQFLSSLAISHLTQQDRSHLSSPPLVSQRSNSGGSDQPASTKISVNTVNLLVSQLPEFSGKEDDDVEIWIQKVERVGYIHGASQDMMLLAVSGKLVKSARKWFELGAGTINDIWISFKNALLRQFTRKIPYQVIMKKVEARKWNFMHESFNDYALEKLSLMQSLKLSDDDSIHYLTDGINNPAIDPISLTLSEKNSNTEASSTVAVSEIQTDRRLDVKSSILKVISLNNNPCALLALLDTGSPVSFISLSAYNRINNRPNSLIKPPISYHSISGDKINILGSFKTKICLESLPYLNGSITLNVLKKEMGHTDLILGRDFISDNDIMMVYYPTNKKVDERIKLFNEMAYAVITSDTQASETSPYTDIKTDFGLDVDRKVSKILKEENLKVDIIDDDYFVKVSLKDDSTYAYAPRRFAWSERMQIREIIDDLLARDIIKTSTSPYCARIVPVRKKNGTLRLCRFASS